MRASPAKPESRQSQPPQANATNSDSTAVETANSTERYTPSRSHAPATTQPPRPTSRANRPKGKPRKPRCAASNATSPDASTTYSRSPPQHRPPNTTPPSCRTTQTGDTTSTARSPAQSQASASPDNHRK